MIEPLQLLRSWDSNWWSPYPPEAYGYQRDYVAVFNLAWGIHAFRVQPGSADTLMEISMRRFAPLIDTPIDGHPMSEWICMYKPRQFDAWLLESKAPDILKQFIRPAALHATLFLEGLNHHDTEL